MPGLGFALAGALGSTETVAAEAQFITSDESNIIKLLAALVQPAQLLEYAFHQLLTERTIDTAEGAQLTAIGDIVGQNRDGRSDEDFRRYCRARIKAHRSNGTIEEILAVTRLVLNDDDATLLLDNQGYAAYVIKFPDDVMDPVVMNIIESFLHLASSAGIRPIIEYGITDPATWFHFDSGSLGLDVGEFIAATDTPS